jgi:hypothetical protein
MNRLFAALVCEWPSIQLLPQMSRGTETPPTIVLGNSDMAQLLSPPRQRANESLLLSHRGRRLSAPSGQLKLNVETLEKSTTGAQNLEDSGLGVLQAPNR